MEGLQNLGIDGWSILLYFINFGVLFVFLTKFLYKPILNIIDERRKHIEDSINEADKLKNVFEKRTAEMTAEKEEMQAKLKEEVDKMRKYAEEKKTEMMKEIELERARMLEETQAEVESKKNQIMASAQKETLELIKALTLHIVHNKVTENVIQESIDDAWQQLKKC